MRQERDADFYDGRMERVLLPLEESPWREVYEAVVGFLPEKCTVVDIGCGTGRCAEAIRRSGRALSYFGFDFSPRRIAEARSYVPSYEFQVADVRTMELEGGNTYVLTEFLEHVEADRQVLQRIPAGAVVVFSVPNFDSQGHVRTFQSPEKARERYQDLLDFQDQPSVTIPKPTRPDRKTFVLRSLRR